MDNAISILIVVLLPDLLLVQWMVYWAWNAEDWIDYWLQRFIRDVDLRLKKKAQYR